MATAVKKLLNNYNILLTLTQDEAETLLSITGRIGGSPSLSRRGYTDSISVALLDAGVEPIKPELSEESSLFFTNKKEKK